MHNHRTQRKGRAGAAAGIVAVCVLAAMIGCGGGGSGAAGGTTTSGLTSTTGAGTTGATVSETMRAATLTSISAKIKTLGTPAAIAASLPAYCKTLPGVMDSTCPDGTDVDILFKDGVWAFVPNSRYDQAPADQLPYPSPSNPLRVPRPAASRGSASTGFRVIDYFGGWPSEIGTFNQMFQAKNYASAEQSDASLDKIIDIDNAKVTFLDTHGGFIEKLDQNGKIYHPFGLLTNNLAPYSFDPDTNQLVPLPNSQRDPATDALIKNGTIGIAPDPVTGTWMCAVSSGYLSGKWSFPEGSILFNSVCFSAAPNATAYSGLCEQAGVGAFIGYTDKIAGGDAQSDALQLFEGMLGTHINKPGTRGRAWNIDTYVQQMAAHGLLAHKAFPGVMTLMNMNNFVNLCPGIQLAYPVDAKQELVLVGDFGNTPGKVTVSGQEVSLVGDWDTNQLTCQISTDPTSPTFSGPIVVTVNKHDSNWVVLRSIEAKGKYDLTYSDSDLSGTLEQVINWDYYMHTSLQNYRTDPFGSLQFQMGQSGNGLQAAPITTSDASYVNSGSWTAGGQTGAQWTGSGPLTDAATNPGNAATYNSVLTFSGPSSQIPFVNIAKIPVPKGSTNPAAIIAKTYDNTTLQAWNTTFSDANFNIQAINKTVSIINQNTEVESATITTNFTSLPKFDSTLQEDQNPGN